MHLSAVTLAALLVAVCVPHLQAAKLPETFERCKRKDPNLNKCLQHAIQKAIRDLKPGLSSLQMLPVDPLAITAILIQEGVGRPVNIKLDLTDVKANGLGDAEITEIQADLDKRVLVVKSMVPFSVLDGDYDMNGKFLVLPLKGKGKCKMEFTNLNATLVITAEPKTKNNKVYWNVVKFDINIHGMDNFKVNFENLFGGDKRLGDNTNKVLNENWKSFWEELRPSFEETFSQIFLQLSNVIFGKVPEKEIFLE